MPNFLDKTKQFLKGRPVRIIIALLIIAGIMTGVAFGIIALMGIISDPCPAGSTIDKQLNKCVQDGCKNVCKKNINGRKKGDCLSNNYCSYSGSEGQYSFDEDSCECKLICSEGEGYAPSGKKSTAMNNKKPVEPLTCGSYCKYASNKGNNKHGGYQWCANGYLCGKNEDETGEINNQGMCFSQSEFGLCPSSSEIVCRKDPNSGLPECTPTSEGERCIDPYCGEHNQNEFLICTSKNDCNKGYNCNKTSYREKFNHLENVGYCADSAGNKAKKPTKIKTKPYQCVDPQYVGEDQYGNAINCGNNKGVNLKYQQCTSGLQNGHPIKLNKHDNPTVCSKWGLCSNGWQTIAHKSDSSGCYSQNEPLSCSEPESICEPPDAHCCGKDYVISGRVDKCCEAKVSENPKCKLTTKKPYDAFYLDSSKALGTIISNPNKFSDSEMEKYTKNLQNSLLSPNSTDSQNDTTNINVIQLHNDSTSEWELHGQCGSLVNGVHTGYGIRAPVLLDGSYSEDTQICVMDSNCETSTMGFGTYGELIPGWPICKSSSDDYVWSKSDDQQYTTIGSQASKNLKNKACTNTDMINHTLKNEKGILEVTPDTPNNYSSVNYKFKCDEILVDLQRTDGTYKAYNWNSLSEPTYWSNHKIDPMNFTSNGVYISQTPTFGGNKCQGYNNHFPQAATISTKGDPPDCDSKNPYFDSHTVIPYNGNCCNNVKGCKATSEINPDTGVCY